VGKSARPNRAMKVEANGWTRSQNARSVGSPLTAYPMSIAAKSISSYLPIRARTNRTRSWMALRTPYRWSACATTATSPNQDGVLGESVGSTWIWTTGSVIFLSSFSHSFSLRKTHFCRLCQFFRAFSPSSLTRCVSRGLGEWRTELPPKRRQGQPRKPRLSSTPRKRRLSSRGAAFLMILPLSQLTKVQQQQLEQIILHEELHSVYLLSQEFVTLLKQRQVEALDSWLKRAKESRVTELGSFESAHSSRLCCCSRGLLPAVE
jgi:hypothetical protein